MPHNANTDHGPRLLDLLPDTDAQSFGAALLRMAHAAAALHRGQAQDQDFSPWQDLSAVELRHKDKAEHGSLAEARSARETGPVTTEGDR